MAKVAVITGSNGLIGQATCRKLTQSGFLAVGIDIGAEGAGNWPYYQCNLADLEETLAGLLTSYDEVAAATDALVATIDLDSRQPLPEAPWFEADASWSARRAFVHIVAETAQHAGHADIIRETIDGQKTMG